MPSYFPERLYQFIFLTTVNEHCSFNLLWSGLGLRIKSITFLQHCRGILLPHLCVALMITCFSCGFYFDKGSVKSGASDSKQQRLSWVSHRLAKRKKRMKKALAKRDSRIKVRYRISYRSEIKIGLLLN